MKCTKLLSKPRTNFWWSLKCTKLVMDEMHETSQFLAEFEKEYCRIWVTSEIHVDVVVLVVWVVRVCLAVWYV